MQESRLRNSLRQWRQEARARASPFGDQSENHRRSTQRNASETDDLKDEIIVRAKEAKPMAHVQTISADAICRIYTRRTTMNVPRRSVRR